MNQKGIALIMAVGVLALLAIIATSFALNMRLEYHAATNYYNGVKARYFAEAALQRAIAELRAHVKSSAFDNTDEAWAQYGYSNIPGDANRNPNSIDLDLNLLSGTGASLTTAVKDEQRKINVNLDGTVSEDLLNNLAAILKNKMAGYNDLGTNDGGAIMQNRPTAADRPIAGYATLREIIGMANPNRFDKDKFALIKNYVTATSYRDPNCEDRAPININTADKAVIAAVLSSLASTKPGPVPIDNNVTAIGVDTAWNVAERIIQYRTGTGPFDSWKKFDDVIDQAVSSGDLTNDDGMVIKYNCNPNRPKPSTHTTEFCFNSGGYYEVIANGKVTVLGISQSDRTLSAIVKIYDIYSETTKAQFELGTPVRVTWFDNCPVNSDDLFGNYAIPSDAETISGSIKLGYWDDFDEDTTYSGNEWVAVSGIRTFIDEDSSDEDNEMTSTVSGGWPKYALNDVNKWTWSNFALRVFCYDAQTGGPLQMKNVGWVMFRDTDPSNPGAGSPAAVHTRDDGTSWLAWDASYYAYEIPFILPFGSGTGVVEFLTDATAKAAPRLYDPPNNYKYKYPSQIRMWPGPPGSSTGAEASYDLDTHRALLPYNRKKTHNIVANGSNVTLTVYTPSNSASFTRSDMPSTPGRQSLYGDIVKVAWDDIRIIPPDGNFTSQVINSTLIPKLADASDFEWGTIASTVTIPSTASAASETVTIKTKSSSDADWTTPPGALGGESLASTKPASGAVSIQYKAFLATADTDINETPVLEDVTITYLPKVSIKSFSVSN